MVVEYFMVGHFVWDHEENQVVVIRPQVTRFANRFSFSDISFLLRVFVASFEFDIVS